MTNKYTSICLTEEKKAKILATGKSVNGFINEAIDKSLAGIIPISKDQFQEELKKFLFSDEMQVYFKSEVRDALLPALGFYLPKNEQKEIQKKVKTETARPEKLKNYMQSLPPH